MEARGGGEEVGARGGGEECASGQRGSESGEVEEDVDAEDDLEGLGEELERCKVCVCLCVCVCVCYSCI